MSHEIGQNDKQQGITMAWHNLTEVLPVIDLKTCFLATWDVKLRPLFRHIGGHNNIPASQEETNTCEVVCTDNESIVIGQAVNRKSYTLLPNSRFLDIIQNILSQMAGAIVESVGSVCNRGRIFVSVFIPEWYETEGKTVNATFQAAGRTFKTYLNFLSSHDKSCPFIVNMGSICTVCNNTFNMNLSDHGAKLRINIKHTSGMDAMLDDVPSIIGAFFCTVEAFHRHCNFFVPPTLFDPVVFVDCGSNCDPPTCASHHNARRCSPSVSQESLRQ